MPQECIQCAITFICRCESGNLTCRLEGAVYPRSLVSHNNEQKIPHVCSRKCLEIYVKEDDQQESGSDSSSSDVSESESSYSSSSDVSESTYSSTSEYSEYSKLVETKIESSTLLEARNFAMRRRGFMFSLVLEDNLLWECGEKGHRWEAPLHKMQEEHTWCPKCKYANERHCRYILEDMSDYEFLPQSFRNSEEKIQYFDGLCEILDLAFEYNGRQHYEYVQKYHKSRKGLKRQRHRDILKREYCDTNSIKFLEIPYHVKDKHAYISQKLTEMGIDTYFCKL